MKNNKNITIIAFFIISVLSSCSSIPPNRESDFQINDDFFEKGDFSSINQMRNQKFLSAVKSSNYTTVQEMLKSKKVSARTCDNFHQTALMWACWNEDYTMARMLLEYPDEYWDSLSWWKKILPWTHKPNSIDQNNVNAKSYLEKQGFKDRGYNYDYSALFCAAYKGDDNIIELLLEHGAKISEGDRDANGENLLHKMAKSGKASNMKLILESQQYGINSKYKTAWQEMYYAPNKNGYTPFHLAILNDDSQMVRLFLELEKMLKKIDKDPIVNNYAELGLQRAYPLYTAYKVRNPSIFKMLLEYKSLNTNIKFPDGNAEHDYDHIDDEFDLEKKREYVFEKSKKDTSTYKIYNDDVNIFSEMFKNRLDQKELVESGKKEKYDVSSDNYKINAHKLIDILEFCTENDKKLTFTETMRKLNKLKIDLYGDLGGIGYDDKKDLLHLVADNKFLSSDKKILLTDWLFDSGYFYLNADDDILYYCLKHASASNKDYLDIGIHLINSLSKYKGRYKTHRPNHEAWVQIMTNDYIRNSLPWNTENGLENLLNKINKNFPFSTGWRNKNITCAVVGMIDENTVPHAKIKLPTHALSLFKYFKQKGQYNESITIDETPLCSWFFEIGFDEGIDEILKDTELTKCLRLDASYDNHNNKRFIDLLNENTTTDEKRQQKISEWKEKYKKIYPLEFETKNLLNTTKNSKETRSKTKANVPSENLHENSSE